MRRILLGMSGGTDSSVSAMLLQQQGYEVVGLTFRFWDEEPDVESASIQEARELAEKLNIEHHVYDAREMFRKEVVDYFIDEYAAGRTPFPCVKCNNTLKWRLLSNLSIKFNCSKISTGHYARLTEKNKKFYITEAADSFKDQTFFLWGLPQSVLQKIIFPLGDLTKPEIRNIAEEKGFRQIAEKKDSMGICFCPSDYRDFLKKQDRLKPMIRKGNFVDENGSFLGRHESYLFYTVGQRYGLGINLNKPMFVKEIHPQTNKIVLAPIDKIYQKEIIVENYNLVDKADFTEKFDIVTKIRYRNQATLSRIQILDKSHLKIELQEPVSAVAPGQSAVFYKDGRVLGGGIIVNKR
jgi:tRNA-specific 2-thiouridylase